MDNEETTNTVVETPDATTLSKLYYSETLTGNKTCVAFTEELPALEEAPEQITGTAVDQEYEFSAPGIKKATTIEVPIYYTPTQHKTLRALKNKKLYWFVQLPENTALEAGKPLTRYFQGSSYLIGDTLTAGEFIKDKLTIYKSTDVEESDGFPTE